MKSIPSIARERALLVQVILDRRLAEAADSLLELARLADTAGATVVGQITQRRERATPNFMIGQGKLAEIQMACEQAHANLVIFDNELSPNQVNTLDLSLGIKVIDRTELILQIFARRARSAEAKVQVELAQLQYLVSRIPVSHKQQRFQGGIGMRGPGESPLQLRNAPMRRRIKDLRTKLDLIRARQSQTRARRQWPKVCLVGYTNAGKSTLLNALADTDAYVDDRLFATLDTKTRMVNLGSGTRILLTDTVGFIRHLPHGLVASFRSTLDVAVDADLLLLVTEASHPRLKDHLAVTRETLKEIGADGVATLAVLNKIDQPGAEEAREHLQGLYPNAVPVSARDGTGLDDLKRAIREELERCCMSWRLPSAISPT